MLNVRATTLSVVYSYVQPMDVESRVFLSQSRRCHPQRISRQMTNQLRSIQFKKCYLFCGDMHGTALNISIPIYFVVYLSIKVTVKLEYSNNAHKKNCTRQSTKKERNKQKLRLSKFATLAAVENFNVRLTLKII